MYGGHRVFFSGYRAFVKIDGETVEYEELEPLGSAIIAAEIITMRYRMATPKDIHIPAGD
jgi:hypothetical protein